MIVVIILGVTALLDNWYCTVKSSIVYDGMVSPWGRMVNFVYIFVCIVYSCGIATFNKLSVS